jgi:hypothetical protein
MGRGVVNRKQQEYLRRRELDERAAEKNAACDAARRAHHELAEGYAERLREQDRSE